MKIKRSQLKDLIKECLTEMFAEEFLRTIMESRLDEFVALQLNDVVAEARQHVQVQHTPQQQYFSQQQPNRQQMLREAAPDINPTQQHVSPPMHAPEQDDLANRMSKFKQTLNDVHYGGVPQQPVIQASQPRTQPTSTDSSSNMMQSIFADTAATTLQEQAAGDRPGAGPGHSHTDPGIDISGMFNPNWATMAGIK